MRYLTTNKLIELIALKAALPVTSVTFTESDFLSFINEQMDMHIVPHIKSFHEDYLIVTEFIEMKNGVNRYAIPDRAIGNALRDVSYTADKLNYKELTRIQVEDLIDYNLGYLSRFYLEAGEIVLDPRYTVPSGYLSVSYYQRPNEIVSENDAAVVTSVNRYSGLVMVDKAPESFTVNELYDITSSKQPHRLIALDMSIEGMPTEDSLVMTFGTSKSLFITNSSDVADYSNAYYTVTDNSSGLNEKFIFYFGTAPILPGTLIPVNISGLTVVSDVLHTLASAVNTQFGDGRLSMSSIVGNSFTFSNGGIGISVGDNFSIESSLILNIDVLSAGTMTIPDGLKKNDVIALQGQTIIPQVPSELHPMLAQGCAMRCLETLGDTQGLQNAALKFQEMEQKTSELINNRVESAPLKIVPRHSPLRRRVPRYRS